MAAIPTGWTARLVTALLLVLAAVRADAFCPRPTPKLCAEYFESDAVFLATVNAQTLVDDTETRRFSLRVSKVFRGSVPSTTFVYSGNDSGGVRWESGRQYIVFAKRRRDRLVTYDDCSPVSDPVNLTETVKDIDLLRLASDSYVEGAVLDQQDGDRGLAGISIVVRGDKGTSQVASGADGTFQWALPPGTYHVAIDQRVVIQSSYNSVDLDHLVLQPGQCAQVRLIAAEPR